MDLAKQSLDVGLFTNRLDEMRAFYAEEVGLPFEELLPVGGGVHQHRFGLNGSVLKLNHARDTLTDAPTGYRRLSIRTDRPSRAMTDPDGLEVELVQDGAPLSIELAVRDASAHEEFLAGFGAERTETGEYSVGSTVLFVRESRGAAPAGPLRARGFRYLTVQIRDVVSEHARLLSRGVDEGTRPVRMGDVAVMSFVRDPDGNWIELSQRASLTGPLPRLD